MLGVTESTIRLQEHRARLKLSRYMPQSNSESIEELSPAELTQPRKRHLEEGGQDRQGWRQGSFISQLSEMDRAALLATAKPVRFEDDEILLLQGDAGDFLYVLTNGFVKDIVAVASGAETLINIRSRGDLVGELAVLDGGRHMATARAIGPVTAARVTAAAFMAIISESSAVERMVGRYIVAQVRASYKQHAAERLWDARELLAQSLYELAKAHGEPGPDGVVQLPIGQSELGELAGVAMSTAERILKDLRERGVLSTGYREILIRDMAYLDRIRFA